MDEEQERRMAELVDEVSQLTEQYRREVPGRRRAWPESIKARVLELGRLGLSTQAICESTKISYFTLHHWMYPRRGRQPSFEPVKIVERRALPDPAEVAKPGKIATVTVTNAAKGLQRSKKHKLPVVPRAPMATVTVTLPGGIRVEHASAKFLAELIRRLGLR